jgi:hypothetical protein
MSKPHQVAIGAGRVDDDEIEGPLDCAHGIHELLELGRFVVGDLHGLAKLDAVMHGEFEIEAGTAGPGAPIADVTGETLLPAVEIDRGNPLAGLQQGDGNMQRGGGFAGTAFLIAQHDDMG